MNLSEHSTEVVGFESSWNIDRNVMVKDSGTDPMKCEKSVENKLNGQDKQDIGIQAGIVTMSISNEETDKKLAAWLKKILPQVEIELNEGITEVYEDKQNTSQKSLKISEYQDINVAKLFSETKNFSEKQLAKGAATWLSVSTQNSPVLVVSCSTQQNLNESKNSLVILYEPQKKNGALVWTEISVIPVKDHIEMLVTNQYNRDMFAGASASGDFYIWNYHHSVNNEIKTRVTETFSKNTDDSIVGLAWLRDQCLLCCHTDGTINMWKVNKQTTFIEKVLKISPKYSNDSLITSMISITDSNNFVLGTLNGHLLFCSTTQVLPFANQDKNIFDPVIKDFKPHQFAISSLIHCQNNAKSYLVSCDSSDEIIFHEVDDNIVKEVKLAVKLPLPFNGQIVCTNNLEHIISPIEDGSLKLFSVSRNTLVTKVEGKLRGIGSIIEMSRNENWIVTGVYRGVFKIFRIEHDL
ncbi:unnamed protein product [Diamesa serratosioi]